MKNSTQLLWRQEAELTGRRVLVADADDPALGALPSATLTVQSDHVEVGAGQWAPLPTLPAKTDLVILPLPKSAERLDLLLRVLAGATSTPLDVWLVGPAKGGIRGGVTRLKQHADEVAVVDSARHCKLYRGRLRPGPETRLEDAETLLKVGGLTVVSYPGVFSHGRLDEGTDMLLDVLHQSPLAGPVLDIGCGNGVLSAALARAGCQVEGVDVSATAVAAASETLARNGLSGHIRGADLYGESPTRYQALVSNPPFHAGRERTTAIARRLIQEAPGRLRDDGVLWLVANRELPYARWLQESFADVQVLKQNTRFRVYRARRC